MRPVVGAMQHDPLVKKVREEKVVAEVGKVMVNISAQLNAEIERQVRMATISREGEALVKREGALYRSGSAVNGTAAGITANPWSPTPTIETIARLHPMFSRGSAARRVGDSMNSGASVYPRRWRALSR